MRKQLLKIILKFISRDIFRDYFGLKKIEFVPSREVEKYREEQLRKILRHAWKFSPYYKENLELAEVVSAKGQVNLANFRLIKPLTRSDLVQRYEQLLTVDPCDKSRKTYKNHSGGSSGEPVFFSQDNLFWTSSMGIKWLFYSFIWPFPCRLLSLWGSERDILEGGEGFVGNLKLWLYDRKLLNSFRMSPAEMELYVRKINRFKPKIIEAYVQSIYEFAKYIDKNKLTVYSPKGIIVSAGTLYPEMRQLIEKVFECRVYNRYGSREVGDIACSCSENEELHTSPLHFVEILDCDLNPVRPGEIGDVYVTTLNNYTMPLIRYRIGDVATESDNQPCKCGRGLSRIKNIEGREMSVLRTKNGRIVPPEFFIHMVGVVFNKESIKKFQIIQKDYQKIVVKVVLTDLAAFEAEKKKIEVVFQSVMGHDCSVVWQVVSEIDAKSNGKFLYVISEIEK